MSSIQFGSIKAQKQAGESSLLLGIADAIVLHRDLTDLFRDLASRLQPFLSFQCIAFVLYDPVHNRMKVHTCHGSNSGEPLLLEEMAIEDSPAGWAWRNQQPLLLTDLDTETRFPKVTSVLRARGMRTLCALPMTTANRRLGAIQIGSGEVSAYNEADLESMRSLFQLTSVAVDNALTQQQVARERDRLRLLLDITDTLVSCCHSFEDLFSAVAATLRSVIQHEVTMLSLYDRARSRLRLYALDAPETMRFERPDGADIAIEKTLSQTAFLQQKALVFHRTELESMLDLEPVETALTQGINTICVVPITTCKGQIGTVTLCSRRNDAFGDDDVELFVDVATQIGIALEKAAAYREVAELKERLVQENLYLEDEIRTQNNFGKIVGESTALKKVLTQIETVCPSDATVLILGETGTGKELIARAIHDLSRRQSHTFVKLNCAAIPTGLLESELFGHEKGAFTGAVSQKIGRLELADQGSLFLDEIGEIPLELQPKLLRVLQDQEFERLGGTRTIRVNMRLVAATNRDLARMVADRQFRSDLYYRLNVFPIHVPALRERRDDIPLLVRFFVQKFAQRMSKQIETIPAETMQALVQWHWPGNIRELENFIERAVILTRGSVLHVPIAELQSSSEIAEDPQTLEAAERDHIVRALRETKGIIAGPRGAATRLGLKRTTLLYKMEKLGISREDFRR